MSSRTINVLSGVLVLAVIGFFVSMVMSEKSSRAEEVENIEIVEIGAIASIDVVQGGIKITTDQNRVVILNTRAFTAVIGEKAWFKIQQHGSNALYQYFCSESHSVCFEIGIYKWIE